MLICSDSPVDTKGVIYISWIYNNRLLLSHNVISPGKSATPCCFGCVNDIKIRIFRILALGKVRLPHWGDELRTSVAHRCASLQARLTWGNQWRLSCREIGANCNALILWQLWGGDGVDWRANGDFLELLFGGMGKNLTQRLLEYQIKWVTLQAQLESLCKRLKYFPQKSPSPLKIKKV